MLSLCLNCISVICYNMQLLFKLNRPFEVASRGYPFIISFSKALALHEVFDIHVLKCICFICYCYFFWGSAWGYFQRMLPFCMREVWVVTACLALINATASHYNDGFVAPDIEKEFYRIQGNLYSLCRVKVNFNIFHE